MNPVHCFQPKTIVERAKIANEFLDKYHPKTYELWLDGMDNRAALMFKAEPERLYIVKDKKIAYAGGVGPFGYIPEKIEAFLSKELGY